MARTQFTFTFRNAEPGAAVTFSADVYSSPADQTADGPALALDASRTVAVWADVSELTATWVDGAGTSIEAEASVDIPVVVETGGVAGASPAPSGGSIPVPAVETAGFALRVNTAGDAYALQPAVLAAGKDPLIRCVLQIDGVGVEERVPYYGRVTDAGDDYLGFRHSETFISPAADGATLTAQMTELAATITPLTTDQITTMGALGNLSTDASTVYVQRLDTPGFARLVVADAETAVTNNAGVLLFASKSSETGTSGVTLTAGVVTLAAGTYAIVAEFAIDVFWG